MKRWRGNVGWIMIGGGSFATLWGLAVWALGGPRVTTLELMVGPIAIGIGLMAVMASKRRPD